MPASGGLIRWRANSKVNLVPERSYWGLMYSHQHPRPEHLAAGAADLHESLGKSVGTLARFFKIQPEEILVVHDELDLEPGGQSSSSAAAMAATTACAISTPSWVRPLLASAWA